ncbi:MAG: hypothetical protein H5U37_06620, partial [Caldisericia bacterium]|nr:hypothetical protein [Caldisericia bacterium]
MKLKIGSNIIYINDKSIIIDVPPQIIEGRTYLPIRWIAEPLGAQVKWDSDEKKVTISLNETIIELWIGKNIARVNDNFKLIDPDNPKVVPLIISGRTMLPVRFVAENLGCKVEWNSNIQTIIITYEKKTDDFYIEDIIAYSFAYPIDMQKVDSRMGFGIWYESPGITGYHLGVDLETEKPEYVKSIGDGYIKYVRLHEAKNDGIDYHAKIVIEHKLPDGRYICSVYYHLDETTLKDSIKNLFSRYDQDQEIVLKKPIKVEKGEVLGKTITILNQQKPHLHFGIRSNKFDSSIIRDKSNGYYGYTKYTEVLAVWWSPEDFIESYKDDKNGFKDLESITIKIISDSVIISGPGLTYGQKGELTNYEQIAKAKKDQIFVAFEKKYKDGYYWYHIWLPSFYGTAQGWIRGNLVEEVEENIIEVIKEEGANIKKFENEQLFDIYSKIYYKQSFVPIREFNNGYIFYTPDYYAVFRNGVRTYRENYPVNTYTAWVSKIDDNINFIERKKEILKKWENIGLNKKWVRSIDIDPFNP